MKRYLMFSGYDHESSGGMNDYSGSFDSIEEGLKSRGTLHSNQWVHFLDTQTGEQVEPDGSRDKLW